LGKLHKKSSKSLNKKNKILLILLICGIVLFFLSGFLLDYFNVFLKVTVSLLMIIDTLLIVIYTAITYNRDSSEDIWWGYRSEIIILCIVFLVWSIALHLF